MHTALAEQISTSTDVSLSIPELSVRKAIWLQILPGIPMTTAYFALSAQFASSGIPNAFALFLAILFVEVPVSWYIMVRQARSEGSTLSLRSLFPFARKLKLRTLLGVGIPAAVASVAVMFALQGIIGEPIRASLFSWLPTWAVYAMTPDVMMTLSGGMKMALALLVLVSGVIVGATTQELYARGFLLPRIAHIGPWATVVSATAFAVMHLSAPWGWPTFAIVALLWSTMAYRWRSTALPVIAHVGMLAIMWLGMLFTLLG